MNEKINKALKETLLEGEQVLWEGGTQPFKMLDGREGRNILIQWILSTIICAALIYLRVSQEMATTRFFVIILIIYALFIVTPFVSYKQLLGLRYYLTDKRAILIKANAAVYTMMLDGVNAKVFPVKPGAAVSIGSEVVDEGEKQLRWRALHALENPGKFDGCNASGLVFYNVERAEAAMRLLSGHKTAAGTN